MQSARKATRKGGKKPPGQRVKCGADSRTSPTGKCGAWAVKGKARCRMHGGAPGTGHPIVHGRSSDRLPAEMRAALDVTLKSATLLDSRFNIATLDVIAGEQAARVEIGDGPTFRTRAIELVEQYRAEQAKENGNPAAALHDLFDHLEDGDAKMQAQMDHFDLVERIDKRTTEANKLMHAKEASTPTARVIELMLAFVASAYRHASVEAAQAMQADLSRMLGVDLDAVRTVTIDAQALPA